MCRPGFAHTVCLASSPGGPSKCTSPMIERHIPFRYHEASSISELPPDEQELVERARRMCHKAYAPYSAFFVGAAILLENGEVVEGSNQENGAYPSGLCAERVAAFAASASHPRTAMQKIAISARSNRMPVHEPVSPCGACRQVLLEYESVQKSPLKVLLATGEGKIIVIDGVKDLLPLSFLGNGLKRLD